MTPLEIAQLKEIAFNLAKDYNVNHDLEELINAAERIYRWLTQSPA